MAIPTYNNKIRADVCGIAQQCATRPMLALCTLCIRNLDAMSRQVSCNAFDLNRLALTLVPWYDCKHSDLLCAL
jgi:hypothetical protein